MSLQSVAAVCDRRTITAPCPSAVTDRRYRKPSDYPGWHL